jgi:hypothetical protein
MASPTSLEPAAKPAVHNRAASCTGKPSSQHVHVIKHPRAAEDWLDEYRRECSIACFLPDFV